jgi:hypothetical protein
MAPRSVHHKLPNFLSRHPVPNTVKSIQMLAYTLRRNSSQLVRGSNAVGAEAVILMNHRGEHAGSPVAYHDLTVERFDADLQPVAARRVHGSNELTAEAFE